MAAFTHSTSGIMAKASKSDKTYWKSDKLVSENTFAKTGTYIMAVVITNAVTTVRRSSLLWVSSVKTEPFCVRILQAWKTSHIESVKNAIVVPVIRD